MCNPIYSSGWDYRRHSKVHDSCNTELDQTGSKTYEMPTYTETLKAICTFNWWVTDKFNVRAKRCYDDSGSLSDALKNLETEKYELIESFFFDLREAMPFPTNVGNGALQELESDLFELDGGIDHLRRRITQNENMLTRYKDILSLRELMCDLYKLVWKEGTAGTDTSYYVASDDAPTPPKRARVTH